MMVQKIKVSFYQYPQHEQSEAELLASVFMLVVPESGDTFQLECKNRSKPDQFISGTVLGREWIIINEEVGPTRIEAKVTVSATVLTVKSND